MSKIESDQQRADKVDRSGPSVETIRHCSGCKYHATEDYYVEDGNSVDSGTYHLCKHPEMTKAKFARYDDRTPEWCPAVEGDPERLRTRSAGTRITDRERAQLADAMHLIVDSGAWMVHKIETDIASTHNADFDRVHRMRHSLRDLHAIAERLTARSARTASLDEPYFVLNGYDRRWGSYSHFNGKVVSYGDVVEWSGIDSDRDVVRERVYTVTYSIGHGPERRGGSLKEGESVPFESGMVFNVSRTDKS